MTINQLHKLTGKLIKAGAGRRKVAIDKATFKHPLESDGCTILAVEKADLKSFEIADDDGGAALDSRGCVKTAVSLVFEGAAH